MLVTSFLHLYLSVKKLQTMRNIGGFLSYIAEQAYLHERLPTLKRPRLQLKLPSAMGWCLSVLVPIWMFLLLDWYAPLRLSTAYSQVVLAQDSTILHAYLTPDQKWRLKTELSEISPSLRKMLLQKEDKYFYYHAGINPIAFLRAAASNIWYGRRESGASTITMQVARLLEPKRRTYVGKLWEILRAFQLEWHYSKDEILQLYLNFVPYGGNIEGVKSASMLYFGKMPLQLSLAEVVTLTIIPNRPNSLTLGKDNEVIFKERNRWLQRLLKAGVFPAQYLQNAMREALHTTRLPAPELAPQFCHRVIRQYPTKSTLHTTLNSEKQAKAENLVQAYMQRLKHLGISNAAVLIVNNETKAVEAYVASADFDDKFHSGQVDGIQAVRSPGSTLKPLVYGLAIDRGIITPKIMMADVPSSFSGFEPENFFKRFLGNVTAEQALIQSLNIPAVALMEQVGTASFIRKLEQAQFKQIHKDRKKLGLSMILGGCGVSLEELTMLFSAVASKGKFAPAQFLSNLKKTKDAQGQLLSPESAYLVSEMLAQATRPDLPTKFANTYKLPKIAWKTGTSYGRRDAWCVGYNPRYTIGVWVGNFSGEGVNRLIGAEIATPLLFQIFNALEYDKGGEWFNAPKGLKPRYVCSETGNLPTEHCTHRVMDYYIPLVSSAQRCKHIQEVWVATDEQTSYCLACLPATGYKAKLYPYISPEMRTFYDGHGQAYSRIPPHNPSCRQVSTEGAPAIISPAQDREYIIDRENPPELLLQCKVESDVQKVYWYINGQFLRHATPQERVFFKPTLGYQKIACTDDKGRNKEISIRVLYE